MDQDKLSLEELLAHFALFTAQDDDDEKNVVKVKIGRASCRERV